MFLSKALPVDRCLGFNTMTAIRSLFPALPFLPLRVLDDLFQTRPLDFTYFFSFLLFTPAGWQCGEDLEQNFQTWERCI